MTSVRILGTGHYVPPLEATNEDFAKFIDTSDEWITTRTGMKTRHIAVNETTWLMGEHAARQAMEAADISPDKIGMVLATTISHDFDFPSLASIIAYRLGIKNAFAVDISVACTGFAFAVDMARRYLMTDDISHVLVVSSETLSQVTDYTDRSTCVLFGDGAGACVLEKAEGIYGSYKHNDIEGTEYVYSRHPRRETLFGKSDNIPEPFPVVPTGSTVMNGRGVYKYSTQCIPDAVGMACEKAGINVSDLDIIIPHQANMRILETAAKNMNLPIEKFGVNIHDYGNTSSASIPICLDELIRSGRIRRGDKICLMGFGSGFNYAATVFEY